MQIAIIKTGGKQYIVKEGQRVEIEKLAGKKDKKITFKEVLFVGDEKDVKVGAPVVKDAKVEGTILEQKKTKKVVGVKQKAKKRQMKKFGHRQEKTVVQIEKIV